MTAPVTRELVLGGQRSGKTQYAETLAADWLRTPGHEAVVVATATVSDEGMRARIERHRRLRARFLPAAGCIEEPRDLAAVIGRRSAAHRLLLVDCLTLWTTNLLAPEAVGLDAAALDDDGWRTAREDLVAALDAAAGPVVLVSGETGLGHPPDHPLARAFVDAMGQLHQQVATACERVTVVIAGQPVAVKG